MRMLLLEAFLYLGWARILKSLPFHRIAPSLGSQLEETAFTYHTSNEIIMKNISHVIRTASRHSWWESMCLVKAIAAKKMLERRDIESTLYLGTARDSSSGKMIAHAWLRSGPFFITGSEEMDGFTVVGIFGKRLKETKNRRSTTYG